MKISEESFSFWKRIASKWISRYTMADRETTEKTVDDLFDQREQRRKTSSPKQHVASMLDAVLEYMEEDDDCCQ